MSTSSPSEPAGSEPETADFHALDYAPEPGVYDELRLPDGAIRPHARQFEASLDALGDELGRRWEQARRLLGQNGVTYNVYADPRGMQRPWELDPIPLVVPPSEWRAIERGLAQRARLLDLVLKDVYGPQRLLREGLLPPELLYENPGFLRPCHGQPLARDVHLHLYAADLGRDAEGRVHVLADRTQAPSGAGYALENRIVLGRVLPEPFRECRVQRLAGYFQELREMLRGLSSRENPMVVLLTPGPFNESYFEHAYLASYLGFTLVHGADLTVRRNVVYLKTLGGLERVDVILRRVDDSYCDPLSLRGESALGVAGLLEAVRAGNVVVANALGSGVLETPAMRPFLGRIAEVLLGESLELPSAETHWCGDPESLALVRDQMSELLLRPAYSVRWESETVFGGALSDEQKKALLARIERAPTRWVAERPLPLSTAPVLDGGTTGLRSISLRTFVARRGQGYAAMPGGLTRVSTTGRVTRLSMQAGSGSKDTWVLTEGPISQLSLLTRAATQVTVSRHGGDLPSRVADNLFWLGRYVERAEATVRLLRTIVQRLADNPAQGDITELPTLLSALATHTEMQPSTSMRSLTDGGLRVLERELARYVLDKSSPRALRGSLAATQNTAFVVRDRISSDAVRALAYVAEPLDALPDDAVLPIGDMLELLNRLVIALAAFSGIGMENLTRGHAWRFADMGRRVERAQNMTQLVRSTMIEVPPDELPILVCLLETADNAISYRRRYLGTVEAAPVADLLLTDESNPRSVAFQLAVLDEHVRDLPSADGRSYRRPEERATLQALTRLRLSDLARAVEIEPGTNRRTGLEEILAATMRDTSQVSDALTHAYFAHAAPHLADAPTAVEGV